MPIVGLGLHVLIALFFAVHAVRSGQPLYWLLILFMFPLFGSIVYFIVIYLPNSRLQHGARKAMAAASKTLDPTKELREAGAAFDYTPTAQNQMRLASAQLEAGMAAEAAKNYEACLKGMFAEDLEIRLGAARAYLACGRGADSVAHLEFIRQTDPAFRPEQVSLVLAQSLAAAGRNQEAKVEFESAVARFAASKRRPSTRSGRSMPGNATFAERLQADLRRNDGTLEPSYARAAQAARPAPERRVRSREIAQRLVERDARR
jgi:hypothetical protein